MTKHTAITTPFLTIEGRVLAKALKPINYVVERKVTYPVVAMVRLTLNDKGLRIVGTDLDIEIGTTLDVIAGQGAFDVCADPITLAAIARVAGPAEVKIATVERLRDSLDSKKGTDTVLLVEFGDGAASYEIDNIIDPDAFPAIPGERGALIETFGNGHLAESLGRCAPFISTEETRYYLNGVYWTHGKDGREFVATDGHRLVRYRYAPDPGPGPGRIIPRKTISLLTRFFQGADASVYDVGGRPMIDIVADGFTIRSKLIDGAYPDYTRVIPDPREAKHCLSATVPGLAAALRFASVMRSNDRYGRAIHLHEADGHLALKYRSADTGNAVAVTDFDWPEGTPDFGLNGRYLSDVLATCNGDVRLLFKDAGSPFLILDGDETMTRVQMPMRV